MAGDGQEGVQELKARLQQRWRHLGQLRRQTHAAQRRPHGDSLEPAAGRLSPSDNTALRARLRFHQFRGVYVRRMASSQMLLQFSTSHQGRYLEPFMMLLQAEEGKFTITKASLPMSVRLAKLEEKLSEKNNLLEFIEYVQACVDAYTFRKFDLDMFKELASKRFVTNLRPTLNLHFVYLTMSLRDGSGRRVPLSVVLKYDQHSCIPSEMKVVAVAEGDEEFARGSETTLSYFLKVPLCDAFALGVKDEAGGTQADRSRSADGSRAKTACRVLRFSPSESRSTDSSSEEEEEEEEVSPRARRSSRFRPPPRPRASRARPRAPRR
ncbi:uncharacterized protein LOC134532046 [Bacillus rossius redtenbacheri]|uniref:uncharacterized protein LOC134532046 n=1 Tax=Bacillus rossius redtenbacheri TaxID=93214 RepID=UPI002FDD4D25